MKYAIKILLIILGSIISAYGIVLAINAGFGGATLAVLWQGISNKLNVTLGISSLIVSLVMILFCLFYDRSQIHVGTIIYQVFYSLFTDIFKPLVFYTDYKIINFIIMLVGILIFAVGTAIYAAQALGRGAYEALTFSIARKHNFKIKYVRIVLDIVVVIIGVLLGGKIGLCTLCTILFSGVVIQKTLKIINKIKNKIETRSKSNHAS